MASAPSFKWVKWRLKPVQSSTSISSSVILMRGSNWLVWSISACARSGTAASSGVIFSPDSVRMASGSSLSLARRVTVANCSSSSCKRSSRYWSLFGLIARGRACSRLSAANFSAGSR
ncbi:hypothetical protein BVL39_07815 [Escherichia coli]|uniref:Uncharacterized protein n=1 Tax=Salmonella choleraesuis (strain SC-B67) TaxID=321314 RepID=Q5J480_SALCH|nr:hypothetical protein SCH_001 [Salmonella enterica subsp. enterica serovar Choleraesuis str. SC-B67]AUL71330.1 hypothetical protein BVL39_07815 [Escherichia coli]ONG31441.1 hypothetical protein BW690_03345 [Escherichia coli]